MNKLSFEVSRRDAMTIRKIVDRAVSMAIAKGHPFDRIDMTMDITAAHASGNPLRLSDLLAADDFNFFHDVWGIRKHLNRIDGSMPEFRPRFSAPAPLAA